MPGAEQESSLLRAAESMLAQRRLDSAREYFLEAQARGASPDRCGAGRWMAAMLKGDFAAAWLESDGIRERGAPDPHRMWEGEDLAGKKVIVRCLHGFGDTVQFARYAARLNQIASSVVWEVHPEMLQMARCVKDVQDVVSWGGHVKRGRDYDVQIEVMELPYLFRTTVADLPIATHYVRVPEAVLRRASEEMGPRCLTRIGVVWNAGTWNESRSVPYSVIQQMCEIRNCEFWNLQGGACRQVRGGTSQIHALCDAPVCSDGVLCLAGAISQMDLVVTADTLAAHLAGALGVTTWLMLQFAADWRWMTARDDSPWYPSMRIFRQPVPGAWAETGNAVVSALESWMQRVERRRA